MGRFFPLLRPRRIIVSRTSLLDPLFLKISDPETGSSHLVGILTENPRKSRG